MALPFFNGKAKKRDQILAVDLGSRITKAVHLQRRDSGLALCGYAVLDAPIFERAISPELLADHLKAVAQLLQPKTKSVALTMNVGDGVVRTVDTPRLNMDDLRAVLKHNARSYLQQELPGHVFDGHLILSYAQPDPSRPGQPSANLQKQRVLIAGAKKQLIEDFTEGAKGAGLTAELICPGLIGPVNAFEMAMPDIFASDAVALVDIGFKNSTICILQKGELVLSRVVNLGGDKMTANVSESMHISYAEAESIKIGLPDEARSAVEPLAMALGREMRASIDFFEHQQDRVVSRVFLSGGPTKSAAVMKVMETELMVECRTWDPTGFLVQELPPQQASTLPEVASQLTVAVGAALAAL